MATTAAWGMHFVAPNKPMERRSFEIAAPACDQVVVEVAGCGLCHTDLGFLNGSVSTRHDLPLVLGHEISGRVIAAGDDFVALVDKQVIVPAVLPCGECELCRAGRDNICQQQKMPGNDFNGGFASHLLVPGKSLCELPDDLKGRKLAELSVVADAITTPYQSLLRSGLKANELAIIIGVGGVGLYMVQHAHNAGARVIALDIDPRKLETAANQGADFTLCTRDMTERDVKQQIRALSKEHHLPRVQWRVFETSGSVAGQAVAFSLLSFAGTLGVVGFTMEKLTLRLSNVMAFDADVFGNWGCSPEHYPAVASEVLEGHINVADNVEFFRLSDINQVIESSLQHQLTRRGVLVPDERFEHLA